MKVFVIFEDDPKAAGGVRVDVMPQMSINDIANGVQPFSTLAGQAALAAKDEIDRVRRRAERIAACILQLVSEDGTS